MLLSIISVVGIIAIVVIPWLQDSDIHHESNAIGLFDSIAESDSNI